MAEYKIVTDLIDSSEYRVKFLEYPVIKRGHPVKTLIEIPGKGTLVQNEGTYEDTIVTLQMDITVRKCESPDQLFMYFIIGLSQSSRLYLRELNGDFFQIKVVEVSDYNQISDCNIEFEVTITCDPGQYIEDGRFYQNAESEIRNLYSESCPVYKIIGNGRCVLSVNGKSMTANVSQSIIIDTQKMLAYREDGVGQNTLIEGNYEDLYLMPGKNSVSITENFELSIKPNWEVRIP